MKTVYFRTTEELIDRTLGLLRKTLAAPGGIMLSGGSTPYVIYRRLADQPCPVHPQRRIFMSDERMVPFDSENNNAHNLEPMLKALGCADRFIRVDTSRPREEAAAAFDCALQAVEQADLGFLGLGSDGHTAGFFTREQAQMTSGPLTLHTLRPDGMEGVSVTPAFFRRVGRIILLVTGESKHDIISTLLHAPQSIPAGIALSGHENVELWTDVEVS